MVYVDNELPSFIGGDDHTFAEIEMAFRSGIIDFYGLVDLYNLESDEDHDKEGAAKISAKAAPRFSIDGMTGLDLSIGPITEFYIATDMSWDGNVNQNSLYEFNTQKVGLGFDFEVPVVGKMGFNAYATYDSNLKDWNGYQVSTNWFTPIYGFENGSYIAYQGYIDFQFKMKDIELKKSAGAIMYNGFMWHSDHYAAGYYLTVYKDAYGFEDGADIGGGQKIESTGLGHYFQISYKI